MVGLREAPVGDTADLCGEVSVGLGQGQERSGCEEAGEEQGEREVGGGQGSSRRQKWVAG